MVISQLLPSCTSFLHVKALASGSQQGLLKAPTLGALSSPLRQFMSILCCRMKANFQGLYMNPGLSRRRFRKFKGSSMPAGGKHSGCLTLHRWSMSSPYWGAKVMHIRGSCGLPHHRSQPQCATCHMEEGSLPSSRHFSLQSRLSSAKTLQ